MMTRRGAVTALAMGVAAPAAALADNPDAELLRLNAELERRWKAWWNAFGPAMDAANDADKELERRSGGDWCPGMSASDEQWRAWWKLSCEIREQYNVEALNSALRAARPPLDEICRQILAVPATTTLTGMGIKARAAAILNHELWWLDPDPEELDEDKYAIRRLIEQTVAAAGLKMPADLVQD